MKKIRFILAAAAIFFSSATFAVDTRPYPVPFIGVGAMSCKRFMDYFKDGNEQQLNLFVSWIWGYLAGYQKKDLFSNDFSRKNQILKDLPDFENVILFLKNHCGKNLTDSVMDGGDELIIKYGGVVIRKKN